MSEPIINHDEATELASLKYDESNLARCYLELSQQLAEARDANEWLREALNLAVERLGEDWQPEFLWKKYKAAVLHDLKATLEVKQRPDDEHPGYKWKPSDPVWPEAQHERE